MISLQPQPDRAAHRGSCSVGFGGVVIKVMESESLSRKDTPDRLLDTEGTNDPERTYGSIRLK